LLGGQLANAAAAGAADPLSAAQAKITAAQTAADQATQAYQSAETRYYEHQADAARTQSQIGQLQRTQRALADIVRARAVQTYMDGAQNESLDLVDLNSTDVLDTGRRAVYVENATASDRSAIDQFRTISSDLHAHQQSLDAALASERDELGKMQAHQTQLEHDVASANQAAQTLRAELDRRQRADQYATLVRHAVDAAQPASGTNAADTGSGQTGQVIASGTWVCPVQGPVSFTDTYGSPRPGGRRHMGNDLFAPVGTPLVAVVDGNVWFQPDPLGGNAAYVDGVDGRTYYYAHLNDTVGGNRPVKAGEIIGHVGTTGDAQGAPPQLHFEIRLGNANGPRIDPYPTLRAHC